MSPEPVRLEFEGSATGVVSAADLTKAKIAEVARVAKEQSAVIKAATGETRLHLASQGRAVNSVSTHWHGLSTAARNSAQQNVRATREIASAQVAMHRTVRAEIDKTAAHATAANARTGGIFGFGAGERREESGLKRGFTSKVTGIGGWLAGPGFVAGAVGGLAVDRIIKQTLAAESATKLLAQTVRNSGNSWSQYGGQIQAVLTKQEKLSGFGSTELQTVFGRVLLTTNNIKTAYKEMALAEDVARGRGIDLASASVIVTRAHEGNIGALGRLQIHVQKVTTYEDQLRNAHIKVNDANRAMVTQLHKHAVELDKQATGVKAYAAVESKYAGDSAAHAKTLSGRWEDLRNTLDDYSVEIGTKLIPVGTRFLAWIQKTVDQFKTSKRAQQDVHQAGKDLVAIWNAGITALKTIWPLVSTTTGWLNKHHDVVKLVLGLWIAWRAALKIDGLVRGVGGNLGKIRDDFGLVKGAIEKALTKMGLIGPAAATAEAETAVATTAMDGELATTGTAAEVTAGKVKLIGAAAVTSALKFAAIVTGFAAVGYAAADLTKRLQTQSEKIHPVRQTVKDGKVYTWRYDQGIWVQQGPPVPVDQGAPQSGAGTSAPTYEGGHLGGAAPRGYDTKVSGPTAGLQAVIRTVKRLDPSSNPNPAIDFKGHSGGPDSKHPHGMSYHYSGEAIDIGDAGQSPAEMQKVWDWLFARRQNFAELIWKQMAYNYGVRVGAVSGHEHHIHVAFTGTTEQWKRIVAGQPPGKRGDATPPAGGGGGGGGGGGKDSLAAAIARAKALETQKAASVVGGAKLVLKGKLDATQIDNAKMIFAIAKAAHLTDAQALEMVAAAYAESKLRTVTNSIGAHGLFQLYPKGNPKAEARYLALIAQGYSPEEANVRAILPEYLSMFKSHPGAAPGTVASLVERSGQGAGFYAAGIGSMFSLGGKASSTPRSSPGLSGAGVISMQASINATVTAASTALSNAGLTNDPKDNKAVAALSRLYLALTKGIKPEEVAKMRASIQAWSKVLRDEVSKQVRTHAALVRQQAQVAKGVAAARNSITQDITTVAASDWSAFPKQIRTTITAAIAELRKLQTAKITSKAGLAGLKSQIAETWKTIQDAIAEGQRQVQLAHDRGWQHAVTEIDRSFNRHWDQVMTDFDKTTQEGLAQIATDTAAAIKNATAQVSGAFGSFTIGAGGQTPTEKMLADMDKADAEAQRQKDLKDAQDALDVAMRIGDPVQIAAAKKQVADAQKAIDRARLEQQASDERTAADAALQAVVDQLQKEGDARANAYTEDRNRQRQNLEYQREDQQTALQWQEEDWKTSLDNRTLTWQDFIDGLNKYAAEHGFAAPDVGAGGGLGTEPGSGPGGQGLIDPSTGLPFTGHRGQVPEFASGGWSTKPPGTSGDPRDTIMAKLRPGEFVLTPEMIASGALGGGITVQVTVEGNVTTERDLALAIRDHLVQQGRRSGGNLFGGQA